MSPDEPLSTNNPETPEQDDLRDEYDFATLGHPVRGKYASTNTASSQVITVRLDAGVAKVFPDARAVNHALRLLIDISQRVSVNEPNDSPTS